jgi:hypothetical protein
MKMEKSELIQIPKCEICRTMYSATMKVGAKKVDNAMFLEKIKAASSRAWFTFFVLIIGMIVSVFLMMGGVIDIITGQSLVFSSIWSLLGSAFKTSFTDFIIPSYFINNGFKYMKKKWKAI